MYTLYLITNLVNGKVYIGQTSKSAEERWKMHCWTTNKSDYFHYAIAKYGKEAFSIETITQVETQEEISGLEKKWIAAFKSHEKQFGYNSTLGGEYGAIPNDEVRAKIGAYSANRIHNDATKEKMRQSHLGNNNHFYGKSHKSETIEKLRKKCSQANGGENNYWFGKKLSEKHKANISAAKKGNKPTPLTEEGRRRISEAKKLYWVNKLAGKLKEVQ